MRKLVLCAAFLAGCAFAARAPRPPASSIQLEEAGDKILVANGLVRIEISKKTGRADYAWGGVVRLRGVFGTASLRHETAPAAGGQEPARARLPRSATTRDLTTDRASYHLAHGVAPLRDAVGEGARLTVRHGLSDGLVLQQVYSLYQGRPFVLVEEDVVAPTPVSSNRLGVLALDASSAVDLGPVSDGRVLVVPFDNDEFIRYDARPFDSSGESYEVTAVYDNDTRHGLVVGSVTHDVWKTGIRYAGRAGRIGALEAYAGAASKVTHDTVPHGSVAGTTVRSPQVFVGYFDDWRDGLEAFGMANGVAATPAAWSGGMPFGFNSWAAYRQRISPAIYRAASDFVATQLMPNHFNARSVFINWDSGWNRYPAAELAAVVDHVRRNGQKAGIYHNPFAYFGKDLARAVPETSSRWEDLVLKDEQGRPLPTTDGAYALDPTHPVVKARVLATIEDFKRWGYEYVKLDFLGHAAKEGVHHDPAVTTGIQAYNYGLRYISDAIGDSMFVSLSIAPLFPGGEYAQARRVSCDAFGALKDSEYLLNSASYGWWLGGSVYRHNDPDHLVVAGHSFEEGRTRVNAAVVAGAVFLDSDKIADDPDAQERARALLTNADVNGLARRGRAFRPVEGNTGTHAADVFVSREGAAYHVAVFNFSAETPASKVIDLVRAGLDGATAYTARDLWSGTRIAVKGTLPVSLDKASSTIFELTPSESR